MGKFNFRWGKRKIPGGVLQIHSIVNEITDFLHEAAPSAMKIQGGGYPIRLLHRVIQVSRFTCKQKKYHCHGVVTVNYLAMLFERS